MYETVARQGTSTPKIVLRVIRLKCSGVLYNLDTFKGTDPVVSIAAYLRLDRGSGDLKHLVEDGRAYQRAGGLTKISTACPQWSSAIRVRVGAPTSTFR